MKNKIETKRLVIRRWDKKDIPDLVEGLNNNNISRYMMTMPFPYDVNMAKKFIKESAKCYKEKQIRKYDFALELKSTKKVIGSISLSDVDYLRGIAGIGYWLNESYWKQGLMSEAVLAILKFAFDELKIRRINLTCNENNEGSKAIAKKFGFKLEGTIRKGHVPISTGKVADKLYYGLLKEDWKR
jgi:ribosomal-protein-alanine N-acetyltransferase